MTNVWEQERLGNLYQFGKSGGTPLSSNKEFYNGHIPFLSITDISNSDTYIYKTEKNITLKGLKNSSAWIVPKDSISLAMYASIGKVAILKNNVSTSQAIFNMVFSDELNLRDFIFYALKRMELLKLWNSLSSSGTQSNLTSEIIKNYKITLTKNFSERHKINKLFNKIYSLITLHQRELKILKIFKKSLFQKIIAGKNLTILPATLTKMTNVWEQERLGNLLDVSKIKNISNFFTRSDVFSVSKDFGVINQIEFLGRSFAGKHLKNYKILKTGQLVYTKSPLSNNPYGIIKCNNNIDGIVSSLYAVYQPKENVNPFFIAHFYSIDYRVNNLLKPLIAKGAKNTMNITDEAILGAMFRVPLINEQNKIAVIFSNIISLITLHQRKLNALENLKKTLLEKMFPSENSVFPSIRFKEFTNAWEQERLGNLLNYIRPDNFYTRYDEIPESGKNPVLTANKSFILGYSNETNTFDKECIIFDDFTQDFKYVNFPFLVKSSAIKILINKNTMFDVYSLFLIMLSVKLENFGRARHYINFVQNKNIILCGFFEMKRIRAIFKHLNSIITLHQRGQFRRENEKKIRNFVL
ncbi:restriction endonuclease subunit S [Mycoplasmopsis cynos]|uniref:restriction endonuclease subunit S n=1 Tax=Mycoplasmopsis cynos TaxID=171284 RepID=UPI0021FD1C7D|nr:restriction endonuclease subunit S [Mycoplasmopsis cynos]UWV86566.1 restriction endonuclease subunit S [Mycoplasmopsis cynos]